MYKFPISEHEPIVRTSYLTFGLTLFFLFTSTVVFSQIDPKATTETKALYKNLKTIGATGTLFGHQDAPAYGLNEDGTRWIAEEGRSDIKSILGEQPALIGFDLGHLELNKSANLDDVPFEKIKQYIEEQYDRGGVSTISWHPNNPLDYSKTTWDKVEATIPTILNNKKALKRYKKISLKKLAKFFKSLKGEDGKAVPVIFRPYHEHTGSWFWWGADYCTPEEYKAFWQMTVNYMAKKKVNNLLYAYSTDNFRSKEHYLERYPGDNFVDILGFDSYHRNAPKSNEQFVANAQRMLDTIKNLGIEKDKPYAVSETGLERVTEDNWWTNIVLPVLGDKNAAYILFWRNGRPDHFYAPYPGQSSENDFKKMAKSGKILFENGAKKANLYN
jgi:mannan endo-1,4-beta-mannosidase